ncbi:MAG: hypothetical protein QM762_18225 [Chryseolinea sp.]
MPESFSIKADAIKVMEIKQFALVAMLMNNKVYEPPLDANKIYVVDGRKYGHPQFRLKRRGGMKDTQDTDSIWFKKDDTTKKITFHCIVEGGRQEADVRPFFIRSPQMNLEYTAGGKKIRKVLNTTPSPMINDPINVIQDLHGETEIAWDEIKDLLVELKDETKFATFNIEVVSELWWQKYPIPATRSGPGMAMGWKAGASTASVATAAASTVRPKVVFAEAVIAARPEVVLAPAEPEAPSQPQKTDLKSLVSNAYNKSNADVFGPLSAEFEKKGLNWSMANLVKDKVNYTIYYRPTSQPDEFFFLPQTFRIKAKEQSGEPKITISMLSGGDPNKPELYKINIGITVVPYFNPKAKIDLYQTLNKESKGQVKYCMLWVGGYKSAQFKVRDAFAGDNAVFRGKVQETISSIDPVTGFTLNIDCSLESFDFFKREISDGEWIIGDIVFELISAEEGKEISKTALIPVELDIRKLVGIPAEIEKIIQKSATQKPAVENAGDQKPEEAIAEEPKPDEIKGYRIINNNDYSITVGGAEQLLLSKIQSFVYDADYEVGVQKTWPIDIPKKQSVEVLFKEEDVEVLNGRYWTDLICEPFGISISTPPDQILARVIDYATGDPEVWKLQISCPLFERWTELDPATTTPFTQVHRVDVEIKNAEGQVFSVQLDKAKPVSSIEMSRNISQILKSQQLASRKYQYRVGTVYIVDPTKWTDWLTPESTAGNFLSVIPQKLV